LEKERSFIFLGPARAARATRSGIELRLMLAALHARSSTQHIVAPGLATFYPSTSNLNRSVKSSLML